VEARDCPGPKGFIEAGPGDEWWDPAGVAGEPGASAGSAGADQSGSGAALANDGGVSGAGGSDSAREGDDARVLRTTPADGALGIRRDAQLVIQFSQPMSTASVEAAYRSSALPSTQVSFAWNERRTVLTLTPTSPLEYAAGAAEADGSVSFLAKSYDFGFRAGASTLSGAALPELGFGFRTLRQVSFSVPADPELTGTWTDGEGEGIHNCARNVKAPYAPTVCVGDDPNNVRYDGFLSFDLSRFPAAVAAFSSARLLASARVYGSPELLGESCLAHVRFDLLGQAALSTQSLSVLGPFYAGSDLPSDTLVLLSQDLTASVADDYTNRDARAGHSQYRLSFAQVAANGDWDDLELSVANIRLATTYLIP
jgi:hypothetical protein